MVKYIRKQQLCQKCGELKRLDNLPKHLLICNGKKKTQKNFQCPYCYQQLIHKKNLKSHYITSKCQQNAKRLNQIKNNLVQNNNFQLLFEKEALQSQSSLKQIFNQFKNFKNCQGQTGQNNLLQIQLAQKQLQQAKKQDPQICLTKRQKYLLKFLQIQKQTCYQVASNLFQGNTVHQKFDMIDQMLLLPEWRSNLVSNSQVLLNYHQKKLKQTQQLQQFLIISYPRLKAVLYISIKRLWLHKRFVTYFDIQQQYKFLVKQFAKIDDNFSIGPMLADLENQNMISKRTKLIQTGQILINQFQERKRRCVRKQIYVRDRMAVHLQKYLFLNPTQFNRYFEAPNRIKWYYQSRRLRIQSLKAQKKKPSNQVWKKQYDQLLRKQKIAFQKRKNDLKIQNMQKMLQQPQSLIIDPRLQSQIIKQKQRIQKLMQIQNQI